MLYKIYWFIITLFYYPFFKEFRFPSYIGKPIFTYGLGGVSISKRVRFMPGLRVETHHNGTIIIEEDVSVGQNFHLTSAGKLVIGAHTTILGNAFITNIDHDYREIGKHILAQEYIVKDTIIGPNCFIGYGAAIQAGTVLGKQCIVGAGSVVRGVFPDYSVIVGAPARIVKRYNEITASWEVTNADGSFKDLN